MWWVWLGRLVGGVWWREVQDAAGEDGSLYVSVCYMARDYNLLSCIGVCFLSRVDVALEQMISFPLQSTETWLCSIEERAVECMGML